MKLLKLLRPLGHGCRSYAGRLKGSVVTQEDHMKAAEAFCTKLGGWLTLKARFPNPWADLRRIEFFLG